MTAYVVYSIVGSRQCNEVFSEFAHRLEPYKYLLIIQLQVPCSSLQSLVALFFYQRSITSLLLLHDVYLSYLFVQLVPTVLITYIQTNHGLVRCSVFDVTLFRHGTRVRTISCTVYKSMKITNNRKHSRHFLKRPIHGRGLRCNRADIAVRV